MPKSHFIKVFHSFAEGKNKFQEFLDDVGKTLENNKFILGLNYIKGQFIYSLTSDNSTYKAFESQFYTHFNDFQLIDDEKQVWNYDPKKTVVGELYLENSRFFPFKIETDDDTDFIYNTLRIYENLNVISDKMGIFIETEPLVEESLIFYIKAQLQYIFFKMMLLIKTPKYMLNFKIEKGWKERGKNYFKEKLSKELFSVKIYIVSQAENKEEATGNIKALFKNFMVFKNYPLNQFKLKIHDNISKTSPEKISKTLKSYILSSEEFSSIFHFPKEPKNETSLMKVSSRKLPLPTGVPTFNYNTNKKNEIIPKEYPQNTNIIGISDFRSITVPVGIYDEDRLKHVYVIGKTGVGKSKFVTSLLRDDIQQGKGVGIIDPHGDLIEEVIMHIPEERKKDIIIFDPTDEKFPFCLNPLDVGENESKQILAKGFIEIFKKFFGSNWNSKLEHVLRMVFLALLDKPNATLFDIIRALTDKDFRYEMVEHIEDDVVRNFWTNEFASWSQQFNTEAIMPILNKVGQVLSIEVLKNIFASTENKLDFRQMMDEQKILFVKLPKGKLQEEIMGFMGAMFVTKIYQAAMGRQSISKKERTSFFLYIDEFQNFATDTFNEILSEARKYGLSLTMVHQFMKQIPSDISDAVFGNVGTITSFRISSDDASHIKQHFDPFLSAYDLSNLSQREFYCKMLSNGEVRDPFSLKTLYEPDPEIDKNYINELYEISREKYSRSLEEARQDYQESYQDVDEKIEEFAEPLL